MEWSKLIATPGLIGAIFAAITALILSVKNHRAIQHLESHKVRLGFVKEKLDLLRNTRKELPKASSLKLAFEAVASNSAEHIKPFVEEIREDYLLRLRIFEEIRYCFSKSDRDSMDKHISKIKEKDSFINSHFLHATNEGNLN